MGTSAPVGQVVRMAFMLFAYVKGSRLRGRVVRAWRDVGRRLARWLAYCLSLVPTKKNPQPKLWVNELLIILTCISVLVGV